MLKKGKILGIVLVVMMMFNMYALELVAYANVKQPVSGSPELQLNPSYWEIQLKSAESGYTWTEEDYSVNICDTDGVGDNTSLAIAIKKQSSKAHSVIVRNTLKEVIPQGSTFKFEFDYKVGNEDNFNSDIYGRDFQGAVYGLLSSDKVARKEIGNGWVHYSGYMTDPSIEGNPINWLYLRNTVRPSSNISFLLDNLSVKVVTTPASEGVAEVLGQELVQDGDFKNYNLNVAMLYANELKNNQIVLTPNKFGKTTGKNADDVVYATTAYATDGDASLVIHHPYMKDGDKNEAMPRWVYFDLTEQLTENTDYVIEYSLATSSDLSYFKVGSCSSSNSNISSNGWTYTASKNVADKTQNGMWTTYKHEFTTNAGISGVNGLRLFCVQQVYNGITVDYILDDVKVYKKTDANKKNLLVDGSFECNDLDVSKVTNGVNQYNATDWNLAGRGKNAADGAKLSIVNGYAQDGNSALYVHYTTPKESGNAALFAEGMLTDLRASKTYVIEYKIAGTKANDKYVKAGFGYGNQGTTANGAKRGFFAGELISDGIWRTYQVEVTTGSDATVGSGKYQLLAIEGNANADILIDSIKIYDKDDVTKENLLKNNSFELLTRDYENAQLVDADGVPTKTIVQGMNYIKVDPKYMLNSELKYEGIVIAALYNNDGLVTTASTKQLTNSIPEFEETTISLNLENEIKPGDNYSIKVFYLNSFDTITPISAADVLPVVE